MNTRSIQRDVSILKLPRRSARRPGSQRLRLQIDFLNFPRPLCAQTCCRPRRPALRLLLPPAFRGQRQDADRRTQGYLLIECLVYIGVLFVLLGVSYTALFRCMSNSVALRRNADDIAKALHIGEVWRADVRSATGNIRFEETNFVQVLHLPNPRGQTIYCFATNTICRSYNGGPWSQLLTNVASSTMAADRRKTVTAWSWNLELQTRRNNSRVSPLFTFMSVPETAVLK